MLARTFSEILYSLFLSGILILSQTGIEHFSHKLESSEEVIRVAKVERVIVIVF